MPRAHWDSKVAHLEHPFCAEVIACAKQTTEYSFKRRTEPWFGLSLTLVSWLPGGFQVQVVGVYQRKTHKIGQQSAFKSEFVKSIQLSKLHVKSRNHSTHLG